MRRNALWERWLGIWFRYGGLIKPPVGFASRAPVGGVSGVVAHEARLAWWYVHMRVDSYLRK